LESLLEREGHTGPLCEYVDEEGQECPNKATGEFCYSDGEDFFYTYRCNDHPVTDPHYEWREVYDRTN
jgi:hypothetical protein